MTVAGRKSRKSTKGAALPPVAALAVAVFLATMQTPASALTFNKIVDTNNQIPNTTEFFTFNNSDVPALSWPYVAFDTGNGSIWTRVLTGGGFKRVIDASTPIPQRTETFQQFYGDSVQILDNLVVVVGLPCGGCNSGVGIYTVPRVGGQVRKLVDTNDYLPGSTTDKFSFFPLDFKVKVGTVAFQNRQNIFTVPAVGGPVAPVAGPQDSGFSPPSPYCCIFSSPDLTGSKVVVRAGNVYGRNSIQTVARNGDPLSFRVIADGTTHPPQTPAEYRFDNFEFGQPLIDSTVVFRGASASPTRPMVIFGIYSRGGGFRRLVDNRMLVPGGAGMFDGRYGFDQIVASDGLVVFRGLDEAGRLGLYAVPEIGGAVTKIIAVGDPIGRGFTVASVSIGREALSGGRLAFSVAYASFLGGGMYYTDLSGLAAAAQRD